MTPRTRRMLLCGVAFASIFATASGASARLPLKSLVLQRSDVPAGFVLLSSGDLSNAALEAKRNITPAQVKSYGRLDGFASQFQRTAKSGVTSITSEVVAFRAAVGGRSYYHLIVASDLQQLRAFKDLRHSSVSGMGDENIVIQFSSHTSPAAPYFATAIIAVRRGSYLEYLSTVNPGRRANTTLAVALTKKMDRRVQQFH